MANKGPHTNASQFFVSLSPTPWLQYRAMGIGRVVRGMDVFYDINKLEATNERPLKVGRLVQTWWSEVVRVVVVVVMSWYVVVVVVAVVINVSL